MAKTESSSKKSSSKDKSKDKHKKSSKSSSKPASRKSSSSSIKGKSGSSSAVERKTSNMSSSSRKPTSTSATAGVNGKSATSSLGNKTAPGTNPVAKTMNKAPTSNANGPNNMNNGFGSMNNMNNMNNGFGSMNNGFGSMGNMNNMNNMNNGFGSMNNGFGSMGNGFGSMGGMGGMGSMYGGSFGGGSLYGGMMGPGMGSMYGMTVPMPLMASMMGLPMMPFSLYGGMGGMGSMYGMGGMGGMGSMYGGAGMGGQGSMYGMGSLYARSNTGGFQRAHSFSMDANKEVPTKKPEEKKKLEDKKPQPAKKPEATKAEEKKAEPAKKEEEPKKRTLGEGKVTTQSMLKDAADKKEADKKAASPQTKKPEEKKPEEKKPEEKKPEEEKKGASPQAKVRTLGDGKISSDQPDAPKVARRSTPSSTKPAADSSAAPAGDGQMAPVPSGHNIRGLVLVQTTGNDKKNIRKDPTTVTVSGTDVTVDEVVEVADLKKGFESVCISEARRHWILGHNTSLLLGTGKGVRGGAIDLAKTFLATAVKKLQETGDYFAVYASGASLKGADSGKDLLKDGASYEKLQQASSPVYGPALNGLTVRAVKTPEEAVKVIDDMVANATEANELVSTYFVLQHIVKSANNAVYQSSLNISLAAGTTSHYLGIKAKAAEEPVKLYRYAIGGGSSTLCAVIVAEDDADALEAVKCAKEMREVANTEPRSGNVARFVEFTEKEVAKLREKAGSAPEDKKPQVEAMIKRMALMVEESKTVIANPEKTEPKAFSG